MVSHYPIPSGERSIARLPLDEFTIETTSKTAAGRQTSRNTQFFSADGQRMSVIGRSVDEDGERITGSASLTRLSGSMSDQPNGSGA